MCRRSILTEASSMCTLLCAWSPASSAERFRFPGVSLSSTVDMSWLISDGCVDNDPLTLCAGVGRAVATELAMLELGSEVAGEN